MYARVIFYYLTIQHWMKSASPKPMIMYVKSIVFSVNAIGYALANTKIWLCTALNYKWLFSSMSKVQTQSWDSKVWAKNIKNLSCLHSTSLSSSANSANSACVYLFRVAFTSSLKFDLFFMKNLLSTIYFLGNALLLVPLISLLVHFMMLLATIWHKDYFLVGMQQWFNSLACKT